MHGALGKWGQPKCDQCAAVESKVIARNREIKSPSAQRDRAVACSQRCSIPLSPCALCSHSLGPAHIHLCCTVLALVYGIPIVSIGWLTAFLERSDPSRPLPEPSLFCPPPVTDRWKAFGNITSEMFQVQSPPPLSILQPKTLGRGVGQSSAEARVSVERQ